MAYKCGMLYLPSTAGWMVSWYTGEVRDRTRKGKDGSRSVVGQIRLTDSFQSTSKEKVEAKAEELRRAGYEIEGIYECIF